MIKILIGNRAVCIWTIVFLTVAVSTANWPQFLGPSRNGVYTGSTIAETWPASGLPQLWERPIGEGYSNPVVSNGRLVLFHREGEKDVVETLDAETGETIWRFSYPANYSDSFGFSDGPRASPVIVGEQVYTFGAQGILHCLKFASGYKLWSRNLHQEFDVSKGFFGAAGTPLIEGSRVLLNLGGRDGAGLVALDKDTGRLLWKVGSDEASYASPVPIRVDDKAAIVFFTRTGLIAVRSSSGETLFQHRWRSRSQNSVNVATPLVVGNMVFLSASYGTGATVVRLKGSQVETLWRSDEVLNNHYATSVYKDGVLYGLHGRQEYSPSLRAVDWNTGEVLWSEESFGSGSVIVAGDRLLILREDGELMMVSASPKRYEVISHTQILQGTVRAYAAISNGLYYARDQNTLICVNLRPEILNR